MTSFHTRPRNATLEHQPQCNAAAHRADAAYSWAWHSQTDACAYPEPDETACSQPRNKRWKERDDWKKELNVAATGSKSRIWYRISMLSQGGDRHGERAREEKGWGRKESEQYGHACCLLDYLSSPSTLQQLTQQQDSFPLKWDISQQRGRSLYVQLHADPAKAHWPIPAWSDWLKTALLKKKMNTWHSVHASSLYLHTESVLPRAAIFSVSLYLHFPFFFFFFSRLSTTSWTFKCPALLPFLSLTLFPSASSHPALLSSYISLYIYIEGSLTMCCLQEKEPLSLFALRRMSQECNIIKSSNPSTFSCTSIGFPKLSLSLSNSCIHISPSAFNVSNELGAEMHTCATGIGATKVHTGPVVLRQ